MVVLSVAVQMDLVPLSCSSSDSTVLLILEAIRRGHSVFRYPTDSMALKSGVVYAIVEPILFRDGVDVLPTGPTERVDLSSFDVVLMRQDPPFNMSYISVTYLLERIQTMALVVNDPAQVRNAPEKLLVTEFCDLTPPTLITRSIDEIMTFREEFGDVVMKPLYSCGGRGVVRITRHDVNCKSLIEIFSGLFCEPWVIQQYIPEVQFGDKRVLLVEGEVVGAINRIAASGDFRSNIVRGGISEVTELTARDQEICAGIGPVLRARGLLFVGLDIIGGYLTEVNVTSPTGIRAITQLTGIEVASLVWDAIEARF